MKGMTLEAVTQAVGGVYTGPESRKNTELTAITIDSRQVEKGGLFVAIKGARVEGLIMPGRPTVNGLRWSLSETSMILIRTLPWSVQTERES